MKKTKGISFLLAVAMLITLVIPGTLAVPADAAERANSGMVINKTATANEDGTYTISLEAYATGDKVITETKKEVPTDIILVLDQSGSMAETMNTYAFRAYSGKDNDDYYRLRHNNSYGEKNLYYKLEDGSYASVFVKQTGNWWNYTYTYTYTDSEGQTITIGISEGADTQPTFTLYERYSSSSTTRLQALKTAVTNFADSVKTKAAGPDGNLSTTTDNVNHRIAVVGFATGSYTNSSKYPEYENTEVFVGSNQYNYYVDASSYYSSALQDMDTQEGYNNVIASKNALDARGATYPNYGLEMAKGILDANPVQQGEKRNRVVILFTDGSPGYSSYSSEVASSAVTTAETLKDNGVTVYSVGIFNGADATSAGNQQGTDEQKANWFMQHVSSNNGSVQNPSYYLSAGDAESLNSIFQQISDQIESGGSSTTLSSETVIKDVVASQFQLPEGAAADDITLETYACTGKNGDSYTWSENNGTMGATATVSGDQVSVTGFDFAGSYVGTVTDNGNVTYRGNKLVISFTVKPKDGFLGGNNVYTNTSAGVYENSSAMDPVLEFERPVVDVAIKDVTVTAQDQDVYLLQDVAVASLQNGATAKVGNVSLDLTKHEENWGLESWQNEYVNITVEVKDKDGNVIANDLASLTADSEYTVSVKVTPKTEGTVTEESGKSIGTINVYKPMLTFKDGEVYYGDNASDDFDSNLSTTKWLHGTAEADTTKMGTAPALTIEYTLDADKIKDGKINTKQDIAVNVAVKIEDTEVTQHTTFQHTDCTGQTCKVPEGCEFLLHVNTCNLTITKSGGAGDESYVFDVYKDGEKYTEISVWGNVSETIYELPVGSYTIQENTGWSWRYNAIIGSAANLTAQNPTGSITCNNTKTKNYWLNGFSTIVKNIFDVVDEGEG